MANLRNTKPPPWLVFKILPPIAANFPSRPPQQTHLPSTSNSFCNESKALDQREFGDVIRSNKPITSYIRAGDLESAFGAFEKMTVWTTVSLNSILSGYAKMPGKMREACEVEKYPQPYSCSYNIMLACYLHKFDLASALEFFHKMPAKKLFDVAPVKSVDLAEELFREMPVKSLVSWNAMISGYVENCRA